MRFPPIFFIFVLLIVSILFAVGAYAESPAPDAVNVSTTVDIQDLTASEPPGVIVVYFFYNEHCGECQKALTFMEGFKGRHPDVLIRAFDIAGDPSNQQLFQQFNAKFGVPFSPVPAVFVGDWELMGYENIEARLDEVVSQVGEAPPSQVPVVTLTPVAPGSPPQVTVPLVIAAALVDGINPCAFSVLIFLLVSITAIDSKKKMLNVGIVYIGAVFAFYFLSGIGLFTVVQVSGVSRIFALVAATVALVAGIIMIKEALFPKNGALLIIPGSKKGLIDKYVKQATLPAAFVLGVLVGLFELPCTGGIYLAILSMLSQGMTLQAGIPLLLLYNVIFILPLVLILGIVYFGLPPERIETWRTEKRTTIRLIMGCLMIGIGVIVLYTMYSA